MHLETVTDDEWPSRAQIGCDSGVFKGILPFAYGVPSSSPSLILSSCSSSLPSIHRFLFPFLNPVTRLLLLFLTLAFLSLANLLDYSRLIAFTTRNPQ